MAPASSASSQPLYLGELPPVPGSLRAPPPSYYPNPIPHPHQATTWPSGAGGGRPSDAAGGAAEEAEQRGSRGGRQSGGGGAAGGEEARRSGEAEEAKWRKRGASSGPPPSSDLPASRCSPPGRPAPPRAPARRHRLAPLLAWSWPGVAAPPWLGPPWHLLAPTPAAPPGAASLRFLPAGRAGRAGPARARHAPPGRAVPCRPSCRLRRPSPARRPCRANPACHVACLGRAEPAGPRAGTEWPGPTPTSGFTWREGDHAFASSATVASAKAQLASTTFVGSPAHFPPAAETRPRHLYKRSPPLGFLLDAAGSLLPGKERVRPWRRRSRNRGSSWASTRATSSPSASCRRARPTARGKAPRG